jgi:hypothetical protein
LPWRLPETGTVPSLFQPLLGLGGHRQAFAALGAAALEDDSAVLGLHARQEPMRAAAAAPIRLERTFHRNSLGKGEKEQRPNLQC